MTPATRQEFRALAVLALPITAGHLLQMLMALIDTMMVGPLGATATAAVGLAGSIMGLALVMGFGLCVAVSVFASGAHAAGNRAESSRVLVHGLAITGVFSVGVALFFQCNIGLLNRIGQDPDVVALASPFVVLVMWSGVPALLGACLRNYCEALGRPWMAFFTVVVMLPCNVLFNWMFIYGRLGCPEWGVTGAGVATVLARTLQCLLLLGLILASQSLRPRGRALWRLRWQRLRDMLGIGVPSAFQIFAEAGAFALMGVFAGFLGAKPQAAYQICHIVMSISFMLPLGVGAAATIRIAYACAQKNIESMRRVVRIAYASIAVCMALYALSAVALRFQIPRLFTPDADVVRIAAAAFIFAGLFAVSDGTQAVGVSLLRGFQDVKIPSLAAAGIYWLVALPVAWVFAFTLGYGLNGLFIGLAIALTLVSLYMAARVRRFLRRTRAEASAV